MRQKHTLFEITDYMRHSVRNKHSFTERIAENIIKLSIPQMVLRKQSDLPQASYIFLFI